MKILHIGMLTAIFVLGVNVEAFEGGSTKCENGACVTTVNGVTIKYNDGEWPQSIEGLWFDFTKAGSSEKLTPQEKKTINKSSNLTVPFIQWAAFNVLEQEREEKGQHMFRIGGNGRIDGEGSRIGVFMSIMMQLQKMSMNDPKEFSNLQTLFIRDLSSGKGIPQTMAEKLASKSQFWYECKETSKGIQAVNELPASEVIEGLSGKYVYLKLKSQPNTYTVSAKELGADGEPDGAEVKMLESVVENDPTGNILWASKMGIHGDFTLVTSPEICQRLEKSNAIDGFFSDPKERKEEIKQAIFEGQDGVLYDPSNECKGYLKYKVQKRLEKVGYKTISSIRGKTIEHVSMFGTSFMPAAFYTDSQKSCQDLTKQGNLETPMGKVQIQSKNWLENLENENLDRQVKTIAPNGIFVSGENGNCEQIPNEQLKQIVKKIDSTKIDENYFCTNAIPLDTRVSGELIKKTISGVNIFAAAIVTLGTGGMAATKMKKDDLYNADIYEFKSCIKSFSHDKTAQDKTKDFKARKLQFVTRDKAQCEEVANSYLSLTEDQFISQYLTLKPKATKR